MLFYKAVEVNQSRIQEKEEKHNLTENVQEESALEEIASEERGSEESTLEESNGEEVFSESKTQQEPSDPEIRVLLMDSDYQSYYHASVTVCVDGVQMVYKQKIKNNRHFRLFWKP